MGKLHDKQVLRQFPLNDHTLIPAVVEIPNFGTGLVLFVKKGDAEVAIAGAVPFSLDLEGDEIGQAILTRVKYLLDHKQHILKTLFVSEDDIISLLQEAQSTLTGGQLSLL